MDQEQDSVFTLLKVHCSTGLIYNDKLQKCVENLSPNPFEQEDRIPILAWLSPSLLNNISRPLRSNISRLTVHRYTTLVFKQSGIFLLDPTPDTTILYYLVSSTLILTTEQSFDVFFKVDSNSSRINLRSFINFEKPLSVTLNNIK